MFWECAASAGRLCCSKASSCYCNTRCWTAVAVEGKNSRIPNPGACSSSLPDSCALASPPECMLVDSMSLSSNMHPLQHKERQPEGHMSHHLLRSLQCQHVMSFLNKQAGCAAEKTLPAGPNFALRRFLLAVPDDLTSGSALPASRKPCWKDPGAALCPRLACKDNRQWPANPKGEMVSKLQRNLTTEAARTWQRDT